MKAIILCGGFGTRLFDIFPDTPKPLVPVLNRPFLRYLIDYITSFNIIDEVILSCFYKSEMFEEEFKKEVNLGKIKILKEDQKLGTGGAIFFSMHSLESEENVFVFNGDSLLNFDMNELLKKHITLKNDITLCLTKVEDCSRYGKAEIDKDGKIIGFLEKGITNSSEGLINAGIYVINKKLLDKFNLSGEFSFEKEVLEKLSTRCDIKNNSIVADSDFLDIGTADDFAKAEKFVLNSYHK